MTQKISLHQQVCGLENYYNSDFGQKKLRNQSRVQTKLLIKLQRLVECNLRPQYSVRMGRYLKSEQGLMVISSPQIEHDKILGQIPGSYFSYSHSVGKVSYDFSQKYLLIQLQMNQTDQVPLDYIMTLVKGFSAEGLPKAIRMLEKVKANNFYKQTNDVPSLYSQTWIADILDTEKLPALLQKFTLSRTRNPVSEYVYNLNYLKLAGVLPNIMMDVIQQTQQIPEISIDDDVQIWSGIIEGLIESHDGPVIKEHTTLVMTYEGVKVAVIIREQYFHTYSEVMECDYYVRKVTYEITNQRAYDSVFDSQRINMNSTNYLNENKVGEKNKIKNKQFLYETNSDNLAKYKGKGVCGYKLKE